MSQDVPPGNDVDLMLVEISTALNDLGATTQEPDPRIAPAVELLGKINGEWVSNPAQAKIDANSLAVQLSALIGTLPSNTELSNALDCALQLAGEWSGDDYKEGAT